MFLCPCAQSCNQSFTGAGRRKWGKLSSVLVIPVTVENEPCWGYLYAIWQDIL
jgi:hypothetical protein